MAVAGIISTDKVPVKVLNAVTVRILSNTKNGKKKGGRTEVKQ